MKTFEFQNHKVSISESLERAFLAYYAYYSQPATIKHRLDPKAKQLQWLYDDYRSALGKCWEEYCDTLTDELYDELIDVLDEDIDTADNLCDQFEQIFLTEAAE